MVMPVVRSSGVPAAPSSTVTQSLVPLKDNAEPTLPGTRTAPVMVPLRPLGDESIAVAPPASSQLSANPSPAPLGGGGGGGCVGGGATLPITVPISATLSAPL